MKILMAVVFILTASLCVVAGEPPAIQQLRNDIAGKTVTLATDVGGYSCIFSSTLDFPTRRLVDTEIDPQGGTHYFLRADRFMNVTRCPNPVGRTTSMYGDYISAGMLSRIYRAGSTVVVKNIEAKPDRIEIQLQPSGAGSADEAYAKIKLMLGKGYESLSLEKLETAVAKAIRMPRIESIAELRDKLDSNNRSIANLESQLSPEHDVQARVNAAQSLLVLYKAQADDQARFNSVAFEPLPGNGNSSRMAQLNVIVADGQRQIQTDKIQKASASYSNAVSTMKQSCSRIAKGPAQNLAELDRISGAIQAVQADLKRFIDARQSMVTAAQTIPSADDQIYSDCSSQAAAATNRVAQQRPELIQLEARAAEQRRRQQVAETIANLRADFNRMKQQRAAYDAKLIGTLGAPQDPGVFTEYRAHLQRMIQNRQQAMHLGDEAARPEINSLEDDLRKLR
jgi:hypothetical protein